MYYKLQIMSTEIFAFLKPFRMKSFAHHTHHFIFPDARLHLFLPFSLFSGLEKTIDNGAYFLLLSKEDIESSRITSFASLLIASNINRMRANECFSPQLK